MVLPEPRAAGRELSWAAGSCSSPVARSACVAVSHLKTDLSFLRGFQKCIHLLGISKVCNLICSLHVVALLPAPSRVTLVKGLGSGEVGFAGTAEYLLPCQSQRNSPVVTEHSGLCLVGNSVL